MTRILILVGLIVAALVLFVAEVALGTDSNQVDFWCETGVKSEPVSTPYVVPSPPAGSTWTLLIIKAGTANDQIPNPVVGQAYSHSSGKDISHVILCYEEVPTSTTTTTTLPVPTTTTTEPPGSTTTTTTTVPGSTTTTSTTTPIPSTTTTTTDPPSSTTTTEGPPPTYIESGDGGYIEEDHSHEHESDFGSALLGGGLGILFGALIVAALLGLQYLRNRD